MRALFVIAAFLVMCPFSGGCQDTLPSGPFAGVDLSKLSEQHRLIITQASEDFVLAQEGKRPKYAVPTNGPHPADGGTSFYQGNGYALTIMQSLSAFGEAGNRSGTIDGFIYGPFIKFEKPFAIGNMDFVSSVRFYTSEQLKKLKGGSIY